MSKETFEVTDDHIKLLRAAVLRWDPCETGAPSIDPKRPYGNSSVEYDVAEILGREIPEYGTSEYDEFKYEMLDLHVGTLPTLQIALSVGYFEPGIYEKVDRKEWKRVDT